jgi:hypothetical protein
MVGGIFNGNDANNTCEDAPAIVAACRRAGAPLDFWSINNYAWASYGSELRTGDFGIAKYQELAGLPVMISETGHSSTEDLFLDANARQAKAVPGQVWESLLSGAIGGAEMEGVSLSGRTALGGSCRGAVPAVFSLA